MNIFAITSGVQVGLCFLLAMLSYRWRKKLATLIFCLMAGRAINDMFFFLEIRAFPDGVLWRYDITVFPIVILVLWFFKLFRDELLRLSFSAWLWAKNGRRNH